ASPAGFKQDGGVEDNELHIGKRAGTGDLGNNPPFDMRKHQRFQEAQFAYLIKYNAADPLSIRESPIIQNLVSPSFHQLFFDPALLAPFMPQLISGDKMPAELDHGVSDKALAAADAAYDADGGDHDGFVSAASASKRAHGATSAESCQFAPML